MKIKIQYLKILIAIFSIANSFNARSQTFYKQIGNPQLNEGGQVIIPTNDGNYLVGGYKEDSALIIKTVLGFFQIPADKKREHKICLKD